MKHISISKLFKIAKMPDAGVILSVAELEILFRNDHLYCSVAHLANIYVIPVFNVFRKNSFIPSSWFNPLKK